jgi:hypothetical protein
MSTDNPADSTAGNAATSIILTRDELHVFLGLLGVKALNGQPQTNGVSVPTEEEAIRQNSGEQTLQLRGLLTFEGASRVTLDDSLVALAGTAALPQATYMLQKVLPEGGRKAYYFSRGPDLLVEHTSPKAGILEFRHIVDEAALQQRVRQLVDCLVNGASSSVAPAERVSTQSMAAFLSQYTAGKQDAARAALIDGGCSVGLAQELISALQTYPHWLAVSGQTDLGTERVVSSTVMIVKGSTCCWMFESDSNADGSVSIHVLPSDVARDKLVAMTQPLLRK